VSDRSSSVPAAERPGAARASTKLLFRDRGAVIQVIRVQSGGASGAGGRQRLIGKIPRATLQPPPDLLSACSASERQEIGDWIEHTKWVHRLRQQAAAFALPDAVGAAIEYLRMTGDEGERQRLIKVMEVASLDLRRGIKAVAEPSKRVQGKAHLLD